MECNGFITLTTNTRQELLNFVIVKLCSTQNKKPILIQTSVQPSSTVSIGFLATVPAQVEVFSRAACCDGLRDQVLR